MVNDDPLPTDPADDSADHNPLERCHMITSSPDFGRADFRVALWLFAWMVVGGAVLAWLVAGGSGDISAMFADAPR